jgi:hypothetical protein
MTARRKDVERKVVPRFWSLSAAARQGETSPSIRERERSALIFPRLDDGPVSTLRAEWEEHRSPAYAADLVAAALVMDEQDQARAAAESVLAASTHSLSKEIAKRVLGEPMVDDGEDLILLDREAVQLRIGQLKRSVRTDPRAALLWAELARRYAALGQERKAEASMKVALMLSPHDRFLLRSGARLSLHMGDPERGHRLVASAAAAQADPWLVAAEIAIAPLAGHRSRFIKHGKRILESGKFRPVALSELASALATEALAAGSGRVARRLFEQSLADPTENAVAQAEWASRSDARIAFDERLLSDVEDSFEARAQVLAEAGEADGAIENSWAWLRVEPFASRPAIFGSHEAALARRYDVAIRFAELGLVANPSEFLLRNNAAFALASMNDVSRAEEHLSAIDVIKLSKEEGLVLTATKGLLAFRKGDVVNGRKLYLQTIKEAEDPGLKAIAAVLLAREEIIAHTSAQLEARHAAAKLADAAKTARTARAQRLQSWLTHLDAELDDRP